MAIVKTEIPFLRPPSTLGSTFSQTQFVLLQIVCNFFVKEILASIYKRKMFNFGKRRSIFGTFPRLPLISDYFNAQEYNGVRIIYFEINLFSRLKFSKSFERLG